ncbi:MAG: calcium-binding protein [Rhodobacteraceae bacterium]|nr:calcium-binding protein [Paracoccaceae bacterium]
MKRSTKLALAAVSALGLVAVAVPVIADQTQMPHGGMMGGAMGMMGGGMGMMGGGGQSYAMATFDTNKDGTLSPEEMTAGIKSELATYDTDANGTLSLDEFAVMRAAHTRPMTVRAFQMHDADGDAQVTESEMATLAAMMQNHTNGHQDGMHGAGRGMMDNK